MRKIVVSLIAIACSQMVISQNYIEQFQIGSNGVDQLIKAEKTNSNEIYYIGSHNSFSVELDPLSSGPSLHQSNAWSSNGSGFFVKIDEAGRYVNHKTPTSNDGTKFNDFALEQSKVALGGHAVSSGLESLDLNAPGSPSVSYNVLHQMGFVAEYNQFDESHNWSKLIGYNSATGSIVDVHGVGYLGGGGIVAAGHYSSVFNDTLDFDLSTPAKDFALPHFNTGARAFLSSYDAGGTGNLNWAISIGSSGSEHKIATDTNNNIIFLGGTPGFSGGEYNPLGSSISYGGGFSGQPQVLCAYNSSGIVQWSIGIAGGANFGEDNKVKAMKVIGNNLYVLSEYRGIFSNINPQGTTNVSNNGGKDILLACYDVLTGNLNWHLHRGGTGDDEAYDFTIEGNELYLYGKYTGAIELGTSGVPDFTAQSGYDGFFARYDITNPAAAILIEARNYPSNGNVEVKGAFLTSTNNIMIMGDFNQNLQINPNESDLNSFDIDSDIFFSIECVPSQVNHLPVAGFCEGSGAQMLTGASLNGGTYSGIGVINNVFYPAIVGPGNYNINYEYVAPNTCVTNVNVPITINASPNVIFTTVNDFCENELPSLLYQGIPSGGTYSGIGVSNGEFDPAIAGSGLHLLNYDYTDPITGCSVTEVQTVEVNETPNLLMQGVDANCNQFDGEATAIVNGGEAPYFYYWNTGNNSNQINGIGGGLYTVNVYDDNGCSSHATINISDINGPIISVDNVTNPTCFGGNNGEIQTIISGNGPLDISWSNGDTTESISDLIHGNYELTVTDTAGCTATESIDVIAPNEIGIDTIIILASCGLNDGSITVNGIGGDGTYNYAWTNSVNTSNSEINIGLGVYEVVVTDGSGCNNTFNIPLNENGGPEITLNNIVNAPCGGTGEVNVSVNGNNPTFNWTDNQMNSISIVEDLNGVGVGTYTLTSSDAGGCSSVMMANIEAAFLSNTDICLVTVDTASGTNKIVWEKTLGSGIEYYKIYKESSLAGQYVLLDSIDADSLSEYTDLYANPQVRSWRYKLSAVDACGYESELSVLHKTMHITMNMGIGGAINLNWDNYEGFAFGTYDLYRYSDVDGWNLISSLPNNLNSYSDLNPPSTATYITYFVEAAPLVNCVSTRANHNQSRSNKTAPIAGPSLGGGTDLEENENIQLSLFPNPTNQNINLQIDNNGAEYNVNVVDVTGKTICSFNSNNNAERIELENLESGIYFIQVTLGEQKIIKRVVKN